MSLIFASAAILIRNWKPRLKSNLIEFREQFMVGHYITGAPIPTLLRLSIVSKPFEAMHEDSTLGIGWTNSIIWFDEKHS